MTAQFKPSRVVAPGWPTTPAMSLETYRRVRKNRHDKRCISLTGKWENRRYCDCQVWRISDLEAKVEQLTEQLDFKDLDLKRALKEVVRLKKKLKEKK